VTLRVNIYRYLTRAEFTGAKADLFLQALNTVTALPVSATSIASITESASPWIATATLPGSKIITVVSKVRTYDIWLVCTWNIAYT